MLTVSDFVLNFDLKPVIFLNVSIIKVEVVLKNILRICFILAKTVTYIYRGILCELANQ